MKKILSTLLVTVCLLVAMPAQAQLKFGVKGGLNLAKADFDKTDLKADNFTGFFIGPMIDFTLPIVGLGLDGALLFSQKGTKFSSGSEEETIKENGIEIPVNLKYSIGLGSLASIYLAAGPSFYFSLSGDKLDLLNVDRKAAQVAINLGAGVKLVKHLQIGINYNMPMTESAELKFGDLIDADSYKTKMWQISVAYIF